MFKLNIEDTLTQYNKILGIDEAGRDCCVGPLVVAGVVLPKNFKSDLINDSKKLLESKREKAYELIIQNAIEYKIEFASAEYVDEFNPKQATRNLMNKIVKEFNDIDLIITDFEPVTSTNIKQLNLIKGDSQSLNVAAASILAKVARD
ncbi:ribonuclease HII [Mesomycoplasma ovipneumoniae]|uniref:ribonuclease HII n=1 Tax=Mesomycoplasma ovipneumoniae TaxID=29562 RepID=UPI00280B67A7|nr:ribonuclease HII [Mesomycoplasma ovipneumoniae]